MFLPKPLKAGGSGGGIGIRGQSIQDRFLLLSQSRGSEGMDL